MSAPGQAAQHLARMIGAVGLSEHLPVENDRGVGPDDDPQADGVERQDVLDHRSSFALGELLDRFGGLSTQIGLEGFVHFGRAFVDLEFHAGFLEKLFAARARGGEDDVDGNGR